MKIIIDKSVLVQSLDIVSKAAPESKCTLSILEGVLLRAEGSNLYLARNNLETSIQYKVDCEIRETGSIVVNAKLFTEIIKKMPDEEIDIATTDRKMIIDAGSAHMEIAIIPPDTFPTAPEVKGEDVFEIECFVLRDMVSKVVFAVAVDENRPVLQGMLIDIKNKIMNVVAIDGFSMAWRKTSIDIPDLQILPHGKRLENITKILGDGKVTITCSKNLFKVTTDKLQITLGIVSGEYLKYKRLLPPEFETTVKINVREFLQVLERAILLMDVGEDGKIRAYFDIKIGVDSLKFSMKSEKGEFEEEYVADIDGKPLVIGFNPLKIIDCLKRIEDKEIFMKFTTDSGPSIMVPVEGDKFVYMVLPVKR